MTTPLFWWEAIARLLLAVAIGVAFGIDRGERGASAGVRTTSLICLAAAAAMVAANLLLQTEGKGPMSFATMDTLRLPLGILSGIGFIGAGAILKRGETVQGLTTAATLWFVTVVGLCAGAGFYLLAVAASAGGLVLLQLANDDRVRPHRRAKLIVTARRGEQPPMEALALLSSAPRLHLRGLELTEHEAILEIALIWLSRNDDAVLRNFVEAVADLAGVTEVRLETS